jgi:hypothetical protein
VYAIIFKVIIDNCSCFWLLMDYMNNFGIPSWWFTVLFLVYIFVSLCSCCKVILKYICAYMIWPIIPLFKVWKPYIHLGPFIFTNFFLILEKFCIPQAQIPCLGPFLNCFFGIYTLRFLLSYLGPFSSYDFWVKYYSWRILVSN